MDRNDNSSNPGMVERQMDDSTGGRSEGERLTDREDMVGREGMAGAGSGAEGNEVERGERQARTTPDRDDGSYGNDSGFSGAGTEAERPAPGRTENGGLASDQDISGTTGTTSEGSSRDF
jgi:hypothetical protein